MNDIPFVCQKSFWRDCGAWKPLQWEPEHRTIPTVSIYPGNMLEGVDEDMKAGLFVDIDDYNVFQILFTNKGRMVM